MIRKLPTIASESLVRACGIGKGSIVTIIGAGGKTSLMGAIGQELAAQGLVTLLTTTTRIWPPEGIPLTLLEHGYRFARSNARHARHMLQTVAQSVDSDGKLLGVSPDIVPKLHDAMHADVVVCESDGAAGRSLKVHASHEPVIPAAATHVLIVAGLDCVGRLPDANSLHRVDEFRKLFPHEKDRPLSPESVGHCLRVAAHHVPSSARICFVLNKCDSTRDLEVAREVTAALTDFDDTPLFATHYGRLVAVLDEPIREA